MRTLLPTHMLGSGAMSTDMTWKRRILLTLGQEEKSPTSVPQADGEQLFRSATCVLTIA